MGRVFIANALNFNTTPIQSGSGGGQSYIKLMEIFSWHPLDWNLRYITLTAL